VEKLRRDCEVPIFSRGIVGRTCDAMRWFLFVYLLSSFICYPADPAEKYDLGPQSISRGVGNYFVEKSGKQYGRYCAGAGAALRVLGF